MHGAVRAVSRPSRVHDHPNGARRRTTCVTDHRPTGTHGAWLVVRGLAVGAAATLLALGGHTAAGGHPPGAAVTLGAAAVVAAVALALSRAHWTLPRLLAVLLAAQAGLHVAFARTPPPPAAGTHVHGSTADAALAATEPTMLAGHLAAVVLTAVVLRRGEQWLCGVLDALALRAVRLLDVPLTEYGGRLRPVPVQATTRPRRRVVADAWWERGPPR